MRLAQLAHAGLASARQQELQHGRVEIAQRHAGLEQRLKLGALARVGRVPAVVQRHGEKFLALGDGAGDAQPATRFGEDECLDEGAVRKSRSERGI